MSLGLASNTMTIEQLRLGASVIFIRAFEAIYKTIITEKIIRPMNKADHAANAELFLKALKEITKNSDLDGITGMEISDGDYNAIGVVVCIMFAEGQRLWADRIRRKKAEAARAAAEGKEITAEVPATSSPSEDTHVDSKKSFGADNGKAKLKGSIAKGGPKKGSVFDPLLET